MDSNLIKVLLDQPKLRKGFGKNPESLLSVYVYDFQPIAMERLNQQYGFLRPLNFIVGHNFHFL
jgi:hypothetical protein